MPKLGPYSCNATLAKLDGRTREARLVQSLRAELTAHVGGSPTTTQRVLIDQAAQLQLRLALMDKEADKVGTLSTRRQVQYLAWCGSLNRVLRTLGLESAAERKLTPSEAMAQIHAMGARR
jgi:hypothetical protein